jgi:hypothetical protein
MSTPVATVADALISFILSLLRDPAAVDQHHLDVGLCLLERAHVMSPVWDWTIWT